MRRGEGITCGAVAVLLVRAWFVILVVEYLRIARAAARAAAIAVVCTVWVLCVGVVYVADSCMNLGASRPAAAGSLCWSILRLVRYSTRIEGIPTYPTG